MDKSPKELADEGRYIEAGAIAEQAVQVEGFKLSINRGSSESATTFSGAFLLEDGTEIMQFSGVPLETFNDAHVDFTQGSTHKFLGYVIPERLQEEEYFENSDTE